MSLARSDWGRLPSDGTLELLLPDRAPVPLHFVRREDTIYLAASTDLPRWAQGLLAAPSTAFRVEGTEHRGAVRPVPPGEPSTEVEAQFRQSLGERAWDRHFAHGAVFILMVPLSGRSVPDPSDEVRARFDAYAPYYTAAVQANAVDRYLRDRSCPRILRAMSGHDPLLEIGCGTGLETLPVLSAGHTVIAVDISASMLKELRTRAVEAGSTDRLVTIPGALDRLDRDLSHVPDGSLGGAYSTFGALNIEPNLAPMGQTLQRTLARGSPFFAGILNRAAISPLLWYCLAGNVGEARARSQNPIPDYGTRFPIAVHPLRPETLGRVLGPGFQLEHIEAASVLAPPTDFPRLRSRTPRSVQRSARRMDSALSRVPGVRNLGDWLFVTYRKL